MNSTNNCAILSDNKDLVGRMSHQMTTKTVQASLLMLFNAILMGVVVIIGNYVPRHRRHPLIGVATALFLPIISMIVTTIDSVHGLIQNVLIQVNCYDDTHLYLVFAWTGVVVAISISASAVVAGDEREGRNIALPMILLVKASWSAYLTFSTLDPLDYIALVHLFVIMFAKLLFKYAAFNMAQRSFALGRSPRLIAGYMAQLHQPVHDEHTPALIVMGEDKVKVEEQPHGYNLKQMTDDQGDAGDKSRANNLVTLDRVWGLDERDIILQTSTARPKDLCFSFALFKLLRCRFAKYTVYEAGFIKASQFFRKVLLRGDDCERVFGMIRDELSFINDYYFSSLPIYYSHPLLLPAFGITLSLWSIGYCLWLLVDMTQDFVMYPRRRGQIACFLEFTTRHCGNDTTTGLASDDDDFRELLVSFGSLYYDIVPLYLAIAVLVLADAREIVSYIFSNWTKVALVCHHVNQAWWQRSRVVHKCICFLLEYRGCNNLVKNWDDKMKQCSILVLRPRKTPLLLRRLLRTLDRGEKVEVQRTVKAAIFEALKVKGESFTTHQVDHGAVVSCIRPPSFPVPPLSPNGCSGKKQPGYTILVWHIATSVFEVSQLRKPSPDSNDKTVAIHLSRYCTYLVNRRPELLPDDTKWCRKLYEQVKTNADRVLAKVQRVDDHNQLIDDLSADSNHEVLRNGAKLGKGLVNDSAMGWEKLSSFWVEMILYVAPSENLEAHAEAISQGGELITLLWAMLAHAGITRPDDPGVDGAPAAAEEGRFAN